MLGSNITDLPSGTGPVDITSGGNATSSVTESATSSGMTPDAYFFIIWMVLLLMITVVAVAVFYRRRQLRIQQLPQTTTNSDVQGREASSKQEHIYRSTIMTMLILGSIIGFVLSVFAVLSCNFVSLEDSFVVDVFEDGNSGVPVSYLRYYSIGLWSVGLRSDAGFLSEDGQEDTCFTFGDILVLDVWYKAARVGAISGALLGAIGGLGSLIATIRTNGKRLAFRICAGTFFVASCFQFCTLGLRQSHYCTLLTTDESCFLSNGAIASISAALYWLFCAGAATAMAP